jgi:hypothetical protein
MEDVSSDIRARLPNLVMVGLGKSGTTSLFYYLSQHPEICASDVKEIQFFRQHGDEVEPSSGLDGYAAHFARWRGERYRLEASPQYLHGGGPMIEAVRAALGSPRILITLRNPTDRMWSTYRSAMSRRFLPDGLTFEQYVARCEHVLREGVVSEDDRHYRTMAGGFYTAYVRLWLDRFGDDGRVVFFEQLAADPAAVVRDLCEWLELDAGCVDGFDLSVQNETRHARNFLLHRAAMVANKERFLRSRRRLKAPLRRAYYVVNGSRTRDRIPATTRAYLDSVFAPGNAELAAELAARGYRDVPDWVGAPVAP